MLNAHQRPPNFLKDVYKKYQKLKGDALEQDEDIVDFGRGLSEKQEGLFEVTEWMSTEAAQAVYNAFMGEDEEIPLNLPDRLYAYHHLDLPDLMIIPNLLPLPVQRTLLSHLFHAALSNPCHTTNTHLHHTITYPSTPDTSFFTHSPSSITAIPKDALLHKPLTTQALLTKKLRWMTLGRQYDWTRKTYPSEVAPPMFPLELAKLLRGLFPDTDPQAAIVNLYSPGDTLSLHRDVSEESDRGLISLSVGCDGVFVVGIASDGEHEQRKNEDEEEVKECEKEGRRGEEDGGKFAVFRVRSGDVVYMAGLARWAWHGVPVIVKGSCPEELRDWPAEAEGQCRDGEGEGGGYENWRGWMAGRRVNFNVRQMM